MNLSFFSRRHWTHYALLLLFAALHLTGVAQDKKPYNLLWEISGNGLKRNSYLFGSIHVKDKRAFNFSDSVLIAMEASSAFAMEVHPDSMIRRVILSQDPEITELARRRDITDFASPKADDMPTFVDGYLYGISRKLNKKIFGLEDANDQIKLYKDNFASFDFSGDDSKEGTEQMINLYEKGNIDDLWGYASQQNLQGLELDQRNETMLQAILKVAHSEGLFSVVGAAHLPGEHGLIALLRDKGFTVRAVQATFTGVAKTYQLKSSDISYSMFKDRINNYELEFPVEFFSRPNSSGQEDQMGFDLARGTAYNSSAVITGPLTTSLDKYLDTVLSAYLLKTKADVLSKKMISSNGVPVMEVEVKMPDVYARIWFMQKNSTFYTLTTAGRSEHLREPEQEHFFNSLKIIDPKPIELANWVNFKHETAGFSVKMPRTPTMEKQAIAVADHPEIDSYMMTLFSAVDPVAQTSYIIRYNDRLTGSYVADRKKIFEQLISDMANSGKIVAEPSMIMNDGYEGRELELERDGIWMKIQLFMRGNRMFLLLKQDVKKNGDSKTDAFFSSFKFQPYASSIPTQFSLGNITVQAPAVLQMTVDIDPDDLDRFDENKFYAAVNENSGGMYAIQRGIFNKYFRGAGRDTLYKHTVEGFKGETGVIYKQEQVKMGNILAHDCYVTDSLSGNSKRMRVWVDGKYFYYVSVIADQAELNGTMANDFFNKIKISPDNSGSYDLVSSKASLIINDLQSQDTLVYKSARRAIDKYTFEQKELSIIYEALNKKYGDDTSANGLRPLLLREFNTLTDARSTEFLKGLYNDPGNNDLIRGRSLHYLPVVDKNNYDWYFKNLTSSVELKIDKPNLLFSALRDSLDYVAAHMSELLPLIKIDGYRPQVLDVLSDMALDLDHPEYHELIGQYQEKITALAKADLTSYLESEQKDESTDPSIITYYSYILPSAKVPDLTDEFTNRILDHSTSEHLHTRAMMARIRVGLELDREILKKQLDSLDTRYSILDAYAMSGKLNQVPEKYITQEALSILMMYKFLADDDDIPEKTEVLGAVQMEEGTYYALKITYTEEEGVKSYIGVCGVFDDKTKELDFYNYSGYTKFDLMEEDWASQAKAFIRNQRDQ